jgi:hypothetical protein
MNPELYLKEKVSMIERRGNDYETRLLIEKKHPKTNRVL